MVIQRLSENLKYTKSKREKRKGNRKKRGLLNDAKMKF